MRGGQRHLSEFPQNLCGAVHKATTELHLELMVGHCLYCRTLQMSFSHTPNSCPKYLEYIKAKDNAKMTRKHGVCHRADPKHEDSECQFPAMVMPLHYGAFARPGAAGWVKRHFQRGFKDVPQYMAWLGEVASLEGNKCIQANCVAALPLMPIHAAAAVWIYAIAVG
ncbi:hypothetical protein VC83_09200 [Pseudogymnoascus destructans]|nr:uncharacterized protein VC83_09200 [Pseudogymnoascus destructans]OAF54554.1 hypothetical protein VC83_09200 [Pseudogymnoascus destructans]